MEFLRIYPPARPADGPASWVLFYGDDLVLAGEAQVYHQGTTERPELAAPTFTMPLGTLDGTPVMLGALDAAAPLPDGVSATPLRNVMGLTDVQTATIAGYGFSILLWQKIGRHCPNCGTVLQPLAISFGMECPNCGHNGYPPVSPCIIVLVHDDDGRALLATKSGWGKRYSLVAGFVEPGESLEDCVVREVLEEVGVRVDSVRYIASQPWPFPHQLMVGFFARYAGGEIVIDATELSDARWFTRDAPPDFPPPYAISRQLIAAWLAG